jgi:hypothetical protein
MGLGRSIYSRREWRIVQEAVDAVRSVLPDADSRPPGEVFQIVSEALRLYQKKLLKNEQKKRPHDAAPKEDC